MVNVGPPKPPVGARCAVVLNKWKSLSADEMPTSPATVQSPLNSFMFSPVLSTSWWTSCNWL